MGGESTGDGKKDADKEKKEEKANGSILEEDGKTTTAKPTKAKDDAGKGKSTGDGKKNADKEKKRGESEWKHLGGGWQDDDRRTDEGKRRCGQGKKHRRWKKKN